MATHTTLRLSEALLRRAKAYARQQQTTLTAVMERALAAYLNEAGSGGVKQHVRLPAFGRGGAREGIDLDRTSALLDVMDAGE
jgi:predicted transcriptional regulator